MKTFLVAIIALGLAATVHAQPLTITLPPLSDVPLVDPLWHSAQDTPQAAGYDAVTGECYHPFLSHVGGGTWIDCTPTNKVLERLNWISSVWLGVANGLDTGSSIAAHIRLAGRGHEMNPLLAPLIDNGHYEWFAIAKAGEIAALTEAYDRFYHVHPRLAVGLKLSLSAWITSVGIHNMQLR